MRSLIFLLSSFNGLFAAYCGISTIPYSFEVLPDGSTILGCARPVCFGWQPSTGLPASNDVSFERMGGISDGFLRNGAVRREPFVERTPQTSICMGAASCLPGQWVGGFTRNTDGRMAMVCCTYPPLAMATIRGIAPIGRSEIFSGGETPDNMFDYISNIRPISGGNGVVLRYEVEVARFSCPEPAAIPSQPVYVPMPAYPAVSATGGGGGYFCFAADSKIQTKTGTKRMDELQIGDQILVPTSNLNGTYYLPVTSWLHKIKEEKTQFIVVTTNSGKILKLTAKHLIYKSSCNSTESTLVPADFLERGDCLLEVDASEKNVQSVGIRYIGSTIQKGFYAPLVDFGKLFVDGIAASCYTESSESLLVQSFKDHIVTCDKDSFECTVKNTQAGLLLDMVNLLLSDIRK